MKAHSVTSIMTLNAGDFKRFPGIDALNPAEV
jgi:hypothetical protein